MNDLIFYTIMYNIIVTFINLCTEIVNKYLWYLDIIRVWKPIRVTSAKYKYYFISSNYDTVCRNYDMHQL